MPVEQTTHGGLGHSGVIGQARFTLESIARSVRHQRHDAVVQLEGIDFGFGLLRHGMGQKGDVFHGGRG